MKGESQINVIEKESRKSHCLEIVKIKGESQIEIEMILFETRCGLGWNSLDNSSTRSKTQSSLA